MILTANEPRLRLVGTETGRLSCSAPNLSAVPRSVDPAFVIGIHETDDLLGLCHAHDSDSAETEVEANERFDLAVLLYGDRNAIMLDSAPGVHRRVYFPSLRMAAQARESVQPYAGMLATLCHPNNTHGGSITDVRRNGREIDFGLPGSDQVQTYTLRQDGYYRRKGTENGSAYLVLGYAETYINPDI